MRAQKGVSRLARHFRREPFNKFVDGGNRKTDGHNDKAQPALPGKHAQAQDEFARGHRGDEALCKVTHLVVVVAAHVKNIFQSIEQRHFGVCVFCANEKNDAVQKNKAVGKAGKLKAPEAQGQNDERRYAGRGFQNPGKVVGGKRGPDEDKKKNRGEDDVKLFHALTLIHLFVSGKALKGFRSPLAQSPVSSLDNETGAGYIDIV